MKTVLMIGIFLALAAVVFAQDTQPVAVYHAVIVEGGALTLDLPQDILMLKQCQEELPEMEQYDR